MILLMINVIGGFFIGVFQKGMPWQEAARTYTLLSIGDGLVATIPSLIIATGSGIIVSRAAAEARMGEEFLGQLTFHHRALKLVSGILVVFAMVPGLPTLPFLFFAALIFWIAGIAERTRPAHDAKVQAEKDKAKGGAPKLDTPEGGAVAAAPGPAGAGGGATASSRWWTRNRTATCSRASAASARQFALDMGVVIPSLHLRDNLQLKPGEYRRAGEGQPHRLGRDPDRPLPGHGPPATPSTRSTAWPPWSRPSTCPRSGSPRPSASRPCWRATPWWTPPPWWPRT